MFLDILINGLVVSGMYAVLAVGFALVFGVAKILNMAHTAFYMLAAYSMLLVRSYLGGSIILSSLVSIAFISIIGVICFKLFFDRIKVHETTVMIIAIALAMLFQEILLLIFGGGYRGVPPYIDGFISLLGTRVANQRLLAIAIAAMALAGLWLLLSRTKLGNAIRAVAEDQEIANLMGINVSHIFIIVMGISVGLAAIGGVVMAPIDMINPLMWMPPLTIVLASVVLGGLGSIWGAVLGAVILGYTETLVVFLVPGGSFLKGAVSLTIMVIVLLVRPEGLFGVAFEEERL